MRCSIIFLILTLLALTNSLSKDKYINDLPQNTHNIGLIEDVYFLPSQIYYLNINKDHFGYLSKESSNITLSVQIGQNQKVIDLNENYLYLTDDKRLIKIYDINNKHLNILDLYQQLDCKTIIQTVSVNDKQEVVLSQKQFAIFQPAQNYLQSNFRSIIYQAIQNQQLIGFFPIRSISDDIVIITNGYIIISIINKGNNKEFCLKQTSLSKYIRAQCYPFPTNHLNDKPTILSTFDNIYLSFPGKTLVLSKQLQITSELDYTATKVLEGYVLLDNGLIFAEQKQSIQEQQIVFAKPQSQRIVMKIKDSQMQFVLLSNNKTLATIKKLEGMKPFRAWMQIDMPEKLSQMQSTSKLQNLQINSAQLLIQYQNKTLQYMTIKDGKAKQEWIKKAVKRL